MSLSKFVIERVEDSLREDDDPAYMSRDDLWGEVNGLKEQLEKVEKEKKVLALAIDRLEQELRSYRARPFLEEEFTVSDDIRRI